MSEIANNHLRELKERVWTTTFDISYSSSIPLLFMEKQNVLKLVSPVYAAIM